MKSGLCVVVFLLAVSSHCSADWKEERYGTKLTAVGDSSSLILELFASSTCDACIQFESLLDKAVGDEAAVVLVSQDRNVVRYDRHVSKIPSKRWTVLPFNSTESIELSRNVGAVPTLVVFDDKGVELDQGGYWTVLVLVEEAIPYWLGLRDGSKARVNYQEVHAGRISQGARKNNLAKLQLPPASKAEDL